jgi:hypothetical protein
MNTSKPLVGMCVPFVLGLVLSLPSADVSGQQVWTGPSYTFTKADHADWNAPASQDRITDETWITRKNAQGIFNIAAEDNYSSNSPANTQWAYGSASDWASLTFAPWVQWHGGCPDCTIDKDAVLHLISEDIYLDIMFLSFTCCNQGGGFSYIRAVAPPQVRHGPNHTLTGAAPETYILAQNYPNPFNSGTSIDFGLPEDGQVKVTVYNMLGQEVKVLADEMLDAGFYSISWNATGMPTGVYFYRIQARDFTETRRMVLMK